MAQVRWVKKLIYLTALLAFLLAVSVFAAIYVPKGYAQAVWVGLATVVTIAIAYSSIQLRPSNSIPLFSAGRNPLRALAETNFALIACLVAPAMIFRAKVSANVIPEWYVWVHVASDAAIEEILFRGFVLCWLMTRLSVRTSLVVSTVIFSLTHTNFSLTPLIVWQLTASGIVMGIFALRYDALWPSIYFHAMHNMLVYDHSNYKNYRAQFSGLLDFSTATDRVMEVGVGEAIPLAFSFLAILWIVRIDETRRKEKSWNLEKRKKRA